MTEIIDKCFPAMGTICSVMIYGTENRVHAQQAKNYILEMDKKWSVFRAESEISQLNRTSGKKLFRKTIRRQKETRTGNSGIKKQQNRDGRTGDSRTQTPMNRKIRHIITGKIRKCLSTAI